MSSSNEAVARGGSRFSPLARDVAATILGSLAIAALAQIAVPLYFSPVPITGQTLGILLAPVILGPRRGVQAVLLYLAEGAAGLPVFAGWAGGFAFLLPGAPTGGYLWGFALAAAVIALICGSDRARYPRRFLAAAVLGDLVILVAGTAWLADALGISLARSYELGFAPFIPGEMLKIGLAWGVVTGAWSLAGTNRLPGIRR